MKLYIPKIIIIIIALTSSLSFLSSTKINKKNETPRVDILEKIYENMETITADTSSYIWPTDASYKVTSTFAEFRPTHFHAGIDISTNMKEGFKVYASNSGHVARIKVLPDGYGKMLVLKHPDGYYTIYAHLKDFNSRIKGVLKQEQYKQQSYFVDIKLDSGLINVKQGEVIAYTGGTGAGPPHLHFEILDSKFNPVNPALFTNLKIKDEVPPLIIRIFIAPADEFSTVFNKIDYYIYKNPNQYKPHQINQAIPVNGKIKFGIETKDLGTNNSAKYGIYTISFFLNDSLIYKVKFDRLPTEYTHELLLHYDLSLLRKNIGKFQKLYVEEGNNLPIYNRLPYRSGIIDCKKLPEGYHKFIIIVEDFSGNKNQISGNLLIKQIPELQSYVLSDNNIKLYGNNLDFTKYIQIKARLNPAYIWENINFSKINLSKSENLIELPIDITKYDIIKLFAYNEENISHFPLIIYNNSNKHIEQINIRNFYIDNLIKVVITAEPNFNFEPIAQLVEGSNKRKIKTIAVSEKEYIGYIEPDFKYFENKKIQIFNKNNLVKESEELLIIPIKTNNSSTIKIFNGDVMISYDTNSVYNDFILTVNRLEKDGADIYSFNPQDKVLKNGINIKIKRKHIDENIYFYNKGKWIFQRQEIDDESGYLNAKFVKTLTDVALLRDTNEPTVTSLKISAKNRNVKISFKYRDDLSGIDYYKFRMYINDELIIPEINEEKRTILYVGDKRYPKGNYQLKISIADKAGNINKIIKNFKIN